MGVKSEDDLSLFNNQQEAMAAAAAKLQVLWRFMGKQPSCLTSVDTFLITLRAQSHITGQTE